MNHPFSVLAFVPVALLLVAPLAQAEEPTAEDYIKFHEPFLGSWKATVEEGGRVHVGTARWQLAANKKCFLVELAVEGLPAAQAIIGYDPATKAFMETAFDSQGNFHLATVQFADMKPGKALGKGLIGKYEKKRLNADGAVSIDTETFSCTERSKDRIALVWSNRSENGKSLPDWKLTYQRPVTPEAVSSNAAPAYEHLKPLEWMNGDWVAEYTAAFDLGPAKKGDRVISYASQRWMLDKSYLVTDFQMEVNGRRVPDTHEIVGWDPVGMKLVHWIFAPLGAGTGVWTQVGDKAILRWFVDTKDGKLEGTSFMEKVDADTFTWQGRNVTLGVRKLPDWPKVTNHRKKGAAAGDLWSAWRDATAGTWLGSGTLDRDLKEIGGAKGDRFEYRWTGRVDLERQAIVSEAEFCVAGKGGLTKVRALDYWDPGSANVRSLAFWASGMVEDIVISRKVGTTFLGTYTANSPGSATERVRIRIDFPDSESYVIKRLNGLGKGEVMATWKRKK
jgi:hypothetical protein